MPVVIKNTARDYVHALVCGLSSADRTKRILAMLRAFIDESDAGDNEGIFVMGGLVAFVNQWELLATRWDRVLREDPPVPLFKTSNFRSSEWRMSHGLDIGSALGKTEELAHLLTYPPLLFSVCVSIDKSEYTEVLAQSGVLKKRLGRIGKLWVKTPYNFCFHNIISLTLRKIVDELQICGDVVDFVFDRNDPHFDAANQMLRGMRTQGFTNAKHWESALGDVAYGNDEKLVPLQMADLLAGRLKDHCMRQRDQKCIKALLRISGVRENNITLHIRKPRIEKVLDGIANRFLL